MLLALVSCDKGSNKSSNPQDLIEKTWILDSQGFVMLDEVDVSEDYEGLQITFFADGTYSTSNGGQILYTSGTWKWDGAGTGRIFLDGDFPVATKELSEERIRIEFQLDLDHVNDGRINALLGKYDILLTAAE